MVVPKLYGRMGNQMFQIATAIAYGKTHNIPCIIPNKSVDPSKWQPYFGSLNAHLASVTTMTTYKEPHFHYQEIPAHGKILLDGYFQSFKYFQDHDNEVKRFFYDSNPGIAPYKIEWDVVSVHVRRGDYLELQNHHPVMDLEYFEQAINHFRNKGYIYYRIFSDDISWCKSELNSKRFPHCIFFYNSGTDPYEDISDMKNCEHNIISNSSFSWWGAWLNENMDKIVVAPKKWFGPALDHLNTKDLIPEKWITI